MNQTSDRRERRVADAIVDALEEGGVEYVFGMPGGNTGTIFRSLANRSGIRTVHVRQESIASIMAEAYGRLAGKPAVVMGQGEWIVGNAGQGILEALLGSSPMVILTEMSEGGAYSHHAPYQSGSGDYGSWDTRGALSAISKEVMVSHAPAQAVQQTQLALKHAITGAPGPVTVIFRIESLGGRLTSESKPTLFNTSQYLPTRSRAIDVNILDDVTRAICNASRPVIVAGNGVRVGQACDSLSRLADELDAPVATTSGGKGVFDETDPRSVGVIGNFGHTLANLVVGEADLILAVGTRLSPQDTGSGHPNLIDPSRQTIVQIDIEPKNASWTFPADHVLVGDAGFIMDRLWSSLHGLPNSRESAAARIAIHANDSNQPPTSGGLSELLPLRPQLIIEAISDGFPDGGIVTCDAGENRLFMMQWFRCRTAGGYLQPAGGGGMGYAVPAALAAKIAHPESVSLAVCGDGGFAMSLHALLTAVEENLPIGVVVLNNNALGWVLHGIGEDATKRFGDVDHVAIATALGCDAISVTSTSQLYECVASLPGRSRPFVIDVPTSLDTSFKDLTQDISSVHRSTGY